MWKTTGPDISSGLFFSEFTIKAVIADEIFDSIA
jgi:hypothetical protein